jgi:predicted amidophosphoribosyltransferase
LVHGLKYRNGRSLARPFAVRIVASLPASTDRCDIDCVTWAPTSARRARRRGYDQAELIARDVAQLLGVPCRRLLRRVGRAVPQTGRSRRDRVVGPTFVARVPRGAHGVLVIDDVITTGATLDAARLALVRAGARHVICRAAAATPERATTSFR